MTPLQIKAKLAGAEFCPVLSEHILHLLEFFGDYPQDKSSVKGMDFTLKRFVNTPHVGYFDNDQKSITAQFKISTEQEKPIFDTLDTIAKLYVMYAIMPLTVTYSNEDLDQLRKIEKAAIKLKKLLPTKDSSLYMIMTMTEQIESHKNLVFNEAENAVPVFFNTLNDMLENLISVRSEIPITKLGQFLKLGVKSQKGNLALKIWIDQLYGLWFGYMKRSFDYDGKDGVSGRKRFTEFTHETLIIIHPSLAYNTVENGIRAYLDKYHKSSEASPPKNIV